MEHRYDKRFSSDHKTLIFKNGMPVAIGRIHNFSRGGVFIKTEIHQMDVNQSLEIELIARGSSRLPGCYSERRLCKTLVMHRSSEGVGLMLREDCEDTQKNFAYFFAEEFELNQSASNTFATPPNATKYTDALKTTIAPKTTIALKNLRSI